MIDVQCATYGVKTICTRRKRNTEVVRPFPNQQSPLPDSSPLTNSQYVQGLSLASLSPSTLTHRIVSLVGNVSRASLCFISRISTPIVVIEAVGADDLGSTTDDPLALLKTANVPLVEDDSTQRVHKDISWT